MCHNLTNEHNGRFSRIEARGQGLSDLKTVCDTQQPQGVSTHQISDPYLK